MVDWFVALLAVAAGLPAPSEALLGTWINSDSSVAVEVTPCSGLICGTVVRASPSAEQDARKGGVTRMVGTNVLTGFRPAGPGRWSGKVFVPERGRTLRSTLTMIDPKHIRVEGCILGGLICQHEIWHRAPA